MKGEEITRVHTDVDFEKDGKQASYLRFPHATNESAWGSILIPIIVVKNGEGPTILFTAGVHGDEYEGQVALHKLSRELQPSHVSGRVIILPATNLPASREGKRLSPLDQQDLNRSFPGDRNSTITPMMAHYLSHVLLPLSDVVVDFHSGGRSLDFVPSIIMHYLDDAKQEQKTLEALRAFGAPNGMVLQELDGSTMWDNIVESAGKIFLTTELRGGGRVTPAAVRVAEQGIRNLLRHFGVATLTEEEGRTERLMEVPDDNHYVISSEEGFYEPFLDLGDTVEKGDAVGQLHFLHDPCHEPHLLHAKASGILVCKRVPVTVSPGDCLAVIARERSWDI